MNQVNDNKLKKQLSIRVITRYLCSCASCCLITSRNLVKQYRYKTVIE